MASNQATEAAREVPTLATNKTADRSQETAEEWRLLGLPFDHYSRYALTRRIVGALRRSRGTFRILDVGGHSSPLKHFLAEDFIVLVDVEPMGSLTSIDFRYDEYICGSGAALPFRDGAFDIVAAHDTLEHVPAAFREAFLHEIVRVAGGYVLLTGPVWDEEVARAEARLDSFVKTALNWAQPFLQEHAELGLPRAEEIEAAFAGQGLPFVHIPNGNLVRWLFTQGLRHYLAALPDTESLRVEVDRTYNRLFADSDSDGVCYRRTYLVSKRSPDAEDLQAIAERLAPARPAVEPRAGAGGLDPMLTAFEAHASAMRDHLSALHQQIFQGEQAAFELRAEVAKLAQALAGKDAEILGRQQAIEEARRELLAVQQSTGYRLLERARRAVRLAFPQRSIRGLPYRALRKAVRALLAPDRKRTP